MTHSPESSATNEELIRKVIEAQKRPAEPLEFTFPFDEEWYLVGAVLFPPEDNTHRPLHILEILLDTQGCKAAYGSEKTLYETIRTRRGSTIERRSERWWVASFMTHETWHSGDGNNVREALLTAVSFLPTA